MLVAVKPLHKSPVTAMKSVPFGYSGSMELSALFSGFRLMCNDAIRIAMAEKPENRFKLIEFAYARLK